MGTNCQRPVYCLETFGRELRSKKDVKRIWALFVVSLPGLALGQDLQTARMMMDGAMAELATHTDLTLVLDGTETDGQVQTTFRAMASVNHVLLNGRNVPRIEFLKYQGNQLLTRAAADGERFWNYDLIKREYTSADYATAAFIGKERERLFQNVLLRSKDEQTFLAKLLKDTYSAGVGQRSNWQPWRPSAVVKIEGESIVCTSTVPAPGRLTYIMKNEPGFGWRLNGAEYLEESTISGRLRTIQWTVTIFRGQLPQGTSFLFVPPTGARAVAVNETRGGF